MDRFRVDQRPGRVQPFAAEWNNGTAAFSTMGSNTLQGAEMLYNFSFELSNTSGVDVLADGTFSADPARAVTGIATGPLGETSSTAIDSLALTVFSLGSAPFTDFSLSYSATNAVTLP